MSGLNYLKSPGHFAELFIRGEDNCESGNEYNGEYMGARISAVFVVLVASAFGAFFPVLSSKYSMIRMPPICFFVAKFFGSGVIVATAFIHLLSPASDNLSNDCLGYPFDIYPFAFGICLIVLMLMFFLELIAYRWVEAKIAKQSLDANAPHSHSHFGNPNMYVINIDNAKQNHNHQHYHSHSHENESSDNEEAHLHVHPHGHAENEIEVVHFSKDHAHIHQTHNHLAHTHSDTSSGDGLRRETLEITYSDMSASKTEKMGSILTDDDSTADIDVEKQASESLADYSAQILNVFILEFGIIFHSIFVGLTLSCSGDEFVSLYIVVVFHQMFEGLGLGTRVATVDWPKSKRWTPWLLCLGYSLSTPIAIAIGIGVRNSYPPNSRRALITNGVFDSVSAGILIYTGLIELMAHEFLFSDEFKGEGGFKKMIWAYLVMCVGAGLMALLGRWA